MEWYKYGPFTVFDLETTGMSPVRDRIVEIAAARIECDGAISRFSTLVNPRCMIPRSATAIHRITDQMVAAAPSFQDVGIKFTDFARESTLVAHNARFDLSFLQESLARCGNELWKGKTLDTLALMRKMYRNLPSYSLQNLRRQFNLQDTFDDMQAHRAGADVEWCMQILGIAFKAMMEFAEKQK